MASNIARRLDCFAQGLLGARQLSRRQVNRIFIPISAGLAGPDVSGAMIGEMLGPLRRDHIRTALRTLVH
jgi:hypothetical protein